MIKNVLPFFLDGGIETISSTGGGTKTWSGKSSFVEVSGTTACTLSIGDQDENGKPIKHGTMLVVTKTGASGQIDVDPSSDFTGDNVFSLNTVRDAVLLMYKGPSTSNALGEWIPLTRFEVDTDTLFSGGSVTGATTFSSLVTMSSGFKLGIGATGTFDVVSTTAATESTNRATGVTLNQVAGLVQTNAASIASGASATLTVTNSSVGLNDIVLVTPGENCEEFTYAVTPTSGSFTIKYTNQSAGAIATAQTFRFVVFKLT